MTGLSVLAREILMSGLDDWVPLVEVEGRARSRRDGTEQEIRDWSLAAIKEVAQAGLVEIGELSPRFSAWSEPLDVALERIRDVWEGTESKYSGWGIWLANTPAGDSEAERLLEEDSGE